MIHFGGSKTHACLDCGSRLLEDEQCLTCDSKRIVTVSKEEKIEQYKNFLKEANSHIESIGYASLPEGFRKIICRGIIEYESIIRAMENDYL